MINFNPGFVGNAMPDAPSPAGNDKPGHYPACSVQAVHQGVGKPGHSIPQQKSVRFAVQEEQAPLSQRQVFHGVASVTHQNRLTAAHFDHISDIFQQLLKKDTYLLALQLGLPADYRLKLLSDAAAGHDVKDSFEQQLREMAQNTMLSHLQLLVALTRSGRIDLVETYRYKFGIQFDPSLYEDTLYCEDPRQKSYKIDKALSLFDLCQIFSGKLDNLSATPIQSLAQVMGYSSLLADSELAKLVESDKKRDEKSDAKNIDESDDKSIEEATAESIEKTDGKFSTYWLLEKIIQSKGDMTVREAAAVLCTPEIGQINIARRLIAAAIDPNKVPHHQYKEQFCQEAFQAFQLISALVNNRVMLDPEKFAHALRIPAYRVLPMRPMVVNTTALMEIILQARKCHYYLAPGHILYALQQAVASFDIDRLNAVFQSTNVPLFHRAGVVQPHAVESPFPLRRDLTQMPESVPLTATFLSSLPLSHNWVPIGLAMGLGQEELSQINSQGKSDARLLAFYLSEKLSEPDRQLETGDLYHALLELNDQEAIQYFLPSKSGQRINPLPEPVKQVMKQGLQSAIALCQDHTLDKTPFLKYQQHERVRNSIDY